MKIRLYKDEKSEYKSTVRGEIHNIRDIGSVYFTPGDEVNTGGATHFELALTTFSDYSGGTVERSNARILERELKEAGIPFTLKYWHGFGQSILIEISQLNNDYISEVIEALDNYPALDDEDLAKLEAELIDKKLEELARYDFEGVTLEELRDAYYKAVDIRGEGAIFEEGGSVYFDDDLINSMKEVLQ